MHFAAAAAVLLAPYGVGMALSNLAGARPPGLRGRASAFALGFGLLTVAAFLLGRVGAFDQLVLGAILLPSATIGLVVATRDARLIPPLWRTAGAHRWLLAAAGLIVVFDAFLASAPPTSGDAITYHLAAPKFWLDLGRITDVWWDDFVTFQPLGADMLYAYAEVLAPGGRAGMVVGAGLSGFSAVCVYGLAAALASRRTASLAALIWVAQGMYLWEATGAFVDLVVAGFAALTAWNLVILLRSRSARDAGWTGLAAGMSASTKYFGLLVIAGAAVGAGLVARRPWRPRILLGFALPLLLAAPWYVKNALVTGDPVYPAFAGVLDAKYWGPASELYLRRREETYGVDGLWRLPLLPLEFVLKPERFDRGYSLSTTFFLLAPLALCFNRRWAAVLAAAIGAYTLFWFEVLLQEPRFLLPALPFAAVLAAFALDHLWSRGGWGRRYSAAVLAVAAIPFILMTATFAWRIVPGALGTESEAAHVQRLTGTYDAYGWLDENLPRRGRVLVGIQGLYWLDRPYATWGHPLFGSPIPAEETKRRMRQYDIRYLAFLAGRLPEPLRAIQPELAELKRLPVRFVTSRTLGRAEQRTLVVYRWCGRPCE